MSEKNEPTAVAEQTDGTPEVKKTISVDTIHNDEALTVLANYDGEQTWTDAEEKKLRRKIDWRLMTVLCITYSLQYYDKAMLSQAAIFGLRTDLGLLVGNRYSWSSSIFYLGFIMGAYPTMVIAQRFPIERVACVVVTLWGLTLLLTTVCTNYQGIYAQRFFLGLLESGVSPMFMVIVGSWYKKDEQALRMGIWYSCTGFVGIFSPLINYGFGLINGGVSSWHYMYYFAGALTMFWGICLLFVLPGDPIRAKGFDDRERYIMVARMRTNNAGVRNTHFKAEQVWEVLIDIKFWLMFSFALLSMIANAPISTFAPIIINGFGFSTLNSLLMFTPAGLYAGCFDLLLTFLAMRYKNIRCWLVIFGQSMTIIGSLLLWLLPLSEKGGLLYAIYTLPSLGAGYAVVMGLQVANTAGYTKRSVVSSGLYVGYCLGNFVGPLAFHAEDAPRYVPGFVVVTITGLVAIVLILAYRFLAAWENSRRDKAGTAEGFDNAYDDDLTDMKNPQFRYIL